MINGNVEVEQTIFFCSLMFCPCFADFLHLVQQQPYPLLFCTNLRHTSTLARNSVKTLCALCQPWWWNVIFSRCVILSKSVNYYGRYNSQTPETYLRVKKSPNEFVLKTAIKWLNEIWLSEWEAQEASPSRSVRVAPWNNWKKGCQKKMQK